jgi:hypothetical protein
MTDSVPQDEEMVDDEAVAEEGDMIDISVDELDASGGEDPSEAEVAEEAFEPKGSNDDFAALNDRHLRLVAEFNN